RRGDPHPAAARVPSRGGHGGDRADREDLRRGPPPYRGGRRLRVPVQTGGRQEDAPDARKPPRRGGAGVPRGPGSLTPFHPAERAKMSAENISRKVAFL